MKQRKVSPLNASAPRLAATLVCVLSLAGLAACGGKQEPPVAPSVTVTPDANANKTSVPEPELDQIWPLTGVPLEAAEIESVQLAYKRPAVAVKIENTAAARPQFGLEQADVVWETIVEFDVSRFIAVYHSNYPTEVGPVRSVRPMDMPVTAPLNGVFAYSGGQTGILKMLRAETQIQDLDETTGSAAMWRYLQRKAPHNLHASVEKLAEMANDTHAAAPQEQFVFAEKYKEAAAVANGEAATNISLRLSPAAQPQWNWNASDKKWVRSEGTSPAQSASGQSLDATNVVMITARHYNSGFAAQNNAPVPTYELEGTGTALIATGGKTIEAQWVKKDQQSPMTLVDSKGEPMKLAPGNTWVELVPQGTGTVTVS